MNTRIKVITSEEDYKEALLMLEELLNLDPDPESEEGEKLSLLSTLIKDYESSSFPNNIPDPIDAILFRMEQLNLKPVDLAKYMGSRSRVSEVLSRKRPLTLSMIRDLEAGLGIPAKVLINEPNNQLTEGRVTWSNSLIKEMKRREYFGTREVSEANISVLMGNFFGARENNQHFFGMLRKSYYSNPINKADRDALAVWSNYILKKAQSYQPSTVYIEGTVDLGFMQRLAKLSIKEDSPLQAINYLRNYGISLIIEPHFPQTYLDGATLILDKDHPVIGLTLRHDRLDNFWFTLMHELAHIYLHSTQDFTFFYDELDKIDSTNDYEKSADDLAIEVLIPRAVWDNSPARLIPSPMAAKSLADELGINIAIVAGRMRRENRYQYLNSIILNAKVRQYFPEIEWEVKNV